MSTFVVYLSMQELFLGNYQHKAFWLLPCSLNKSLSEWSESFVPFWQYESFPWPTRKGKYPILRTYPSLTNLIRHTKISYCRASLAFRTFSRGTYWNGLHRGISRLRHPEYLKRYEPYYFDTFSWESVL